MNRHGHSHHRDRGGFGGGGGFPQRPPFARGHGHGHGFGEARGRGRQRRGQMRAAVLHLLKERPMHGYEMIQEISRLTDGQWTPSPGSIYPTLQMLADEGLVTSTEEGGKKLFSLTEAGTSEDFVAPWAGMEIDPVNAELRTAVRLLGAAMEQISHAGTSEQKARAAELYNELRRKLYSILSEE